jgi:hypothetical protein
MSPRDVWTLQGIEPQFCGLLYLLSHIFVCNRRYFVIDCVLRRAYAASMEIRSFRFLTQVAGLYSKMRPSED